MGGFLGLEENQGDILQEMRKAGRLDYDSYQHLIDNNRGYTVSLERKHARVLESLRDLIPPLSPFERFIATAQLRKASGLSRDHENANAILEGLRRKSTAFLCWHKDKSQQHLAEDFYEFASALWALHSNLYVIKEYLGRVPQHVATAALIKLGTVHKNHAITSLVRSLWINDRSQWELRPEERDAMALEYIELILASERLNDDHHKLKVVAMGIRGGRERLRACARIGEHFKDKELLGAAKDIHMSYLRNKQHVFLVEEPLTLLDLAEFAPSTRTNMSKEQKVLALFQRFVDKATGPSCGDGEVVLKALARTLTDEVFTKWWAWLPETASLLIEVLRKTQTVYHSKPETALAVLSALIQSGLLHKSVQDAKDEIVNRMRGSVSDHDSAKQYARAMLRYSPPTKNDGLSQNIRDAIGECSLHDAATIVCEAALISGRLSDFDWAADLARGAAQRERIKAGFAIADALAQTIAANKKS